MDIKRIDSNEDERFRKKVLQQHGAFEVDDLLYEVEIISDYEAVVRGDSKYIKEIIEEINNIEEKEDLSKCIIGDEFELWLKDKKKDCENI